MVEPDRPFTDDNSPSLAGVTYFVVSECTECYGLVNDQKSLEDKRMISPDLSEQTLRLG